MKAFLYPALAGLVLVFACTADAAAQGGYRSRGINDRQHNQRQRISQGVRSGELTARETGRLAAEQVRIRHMEERFRESGDGLSGRERLRLQHALDRSSRDIYRQKHDGQDYQKGRRP